MAEPTKVLVTERDTAPANTTILETPGTAPNVEVVVMRWWTQALVRSARTYAQGIAANLLTVGAAKAAVEAMGIVLPANVFLATCIAVLVEPFRTTAITFIQNALELTAKWDKSNPSFRG